MNEEVQPGAAERERVIEPPASPEEYVPPIAEEIDTTHSPAELAAGVISPPPS
jgi:hypothetical protein